MNDLEPKMPPRSAEEKESSSWWFRQLCTILIVSNAGGVIAVSGFAANTENIAVAAFIAYPSTSLFLAGAVVAALGIIFQFLYVSWRLEGVAEFDQSRNIWRAEQGLDPKISVIQTIAFFLLAILTIISMAGSAFYFYRGAMHASLSTTALACTSLADERACTGGVWLFGSVNSALKDRARRAILSDTAALGSNVIIHPDALPKSDDDSYDRETKFIMRRAAELAGGIAGCQRVELVERSVKPQDQFLVTCSNGGSITIHRFTRAQIAPLTSSSLGRPLPRSSSPTTAPS